MDKEAKIEQLKKILIKASSLEQGKELGMAKEFIAIDEKIDQVATNLDTKLSDISEGLKKKLDEELSYEVDEQKIVASVLSQVEIPDPITGEQGIPGIDGKDGVDGKDGKDGINGLDGIDGQDGKDGIDGKDGSSDTPEEIVTKLSSLKDDARLDAKHIKNLPKGGGGDKFYGGSGIKEVIAGTGISVDNSNLGYPVISAPGSTTDEKVKYNANDASAGFLADKVVAGTGITLSEGTGGDIDKLLITNTLDLTNYFNKVSDDTDDITDTATNRFTDDTAIARLANTSGTNTGDQDLSGYVPYTGATTDVDLGTYTLKTPTLYGGSSSGGNLTLQSTSHATKGKILFGTSAYDEVNNRLGIGLASPLYLLHLRGTGATKATTALYVDNSTPAQILKLNNDGSMAIGLSTTLTGANALAFGQLSQATGDNSFALGYNQRATATGALCMGANAGSGYSEASGPWSVIAGGLLHKAVGRYSTIVGGIYGHTTMYNQIVFGHDRLVSGTGSFQTSIIPLSANITGTAQTELFIPSLASGQAILPDLSWETNPAYTMWNATITVNAFIRSVGNGTGTRDHVFGGEYRCIVRRAFGSTTVTMVGSGVQTIYEDADTTMADAVVTIDGDSSTGALRVRFTPPTTAGSTTVTAVGCAINYLQTFRS